MRPPIRPDSDPGSRLKPNLLFKPNRHFKRAPLTLSALAFAGLSLHAAAQSGAERVEELTISATRLPRTIENIAGTVSLISAERLEEELANDLDDVTRFEPGVTMNTAARGGNQGFRIRGIGGNRVLTVIDGVRGSDIYAAGPSSYGKDSVEIDTLKRVEIIRGPASVLYGADAMGGAVILTSKSARDYVGEEPGSYFGLRSSLASADQQAKVGFTTAFQGAELGLLMQFTAREFEQRDVTGPGRLNPQDGASDSLLLKAFWDPAPGHQLALSLEAFNETNAVMLDSDLGASVTRSEGRDLTERRRIGFDYLWQGDALLLDSMALNLSLQETDALQHTVQDLISYSFIEQRNPMTFSGSAAVRETDFWFNQSTLAANINLGKTLSTGQVAHSIAYGLNFDDTGTERPRDRVDTALDNGASTRSIAAYPFAPTEVFPNKTFPDSSTRRWGVYLQDEIVIADSPLTLIPGIRHDRYELDPRADALLDGTGDIENWGGFAVSSVSENQTSLSLGALFDLNETYSLFAQYAEGYRPPNFDESNQAFVNLGFGYATIPNPALVAESSRGMELGLRANFARAFVSLAAYRNDYRDFIESSFVGMQNNISLFQDCNVGAVRIRGAEAAANFYLGNEWQLRSSLAYSRGDNESSGRPLDSIEPMTAVMGLGYDPDGSAWGGDLLLTLVAAKDRVSGPGRVTADSYSTLDLVGYWNPGAAIGLRAGVFNLLDEDYARWANIQGLEAAAEETIANAYASGTHFRLALNMEF